MGRWAASARVGLPQPTRPGQLAGQPSWPLALVPLTTAMPRWCPMRSPETPNRKLASQRRRTRLKRARRRNGIRVYPLPLSDRTVYGLTTQLIVDGLLTTAAASDREQFLVALARLLARQGARWA